MQIPNNTTDGSGVPYHIAIANRMQDAASINALVDLLGSKYLLTKSISSFIFVPTSAAMEYHVSHSS